MRYMVKGNVFVAVAAGVYLLYTMVMFVCELSLQVDVDLLRRKETLTSKRVDSLIIGGSNSYYSLSAALLSQKIGGEWFNASIVGEGYSDKGYREYLGELIGDKPRQEIKTIVYSSVVPFRFGEMERREVYVGKADGVGRVFLKPRKAMYKWIDGGLGSNSSEVIASSMEGDIVFAGRSCSGWRGVFKAEELGTAVRFYVSSVLYYLEQFPLANVYLVVPSAYYEGADQEKSREYKENLVKAIGDYFDLLGGKPNRVRIVSQPDFPSKDLICSGFVHANSAGRVWRTMNLVREIKGLDG